MAEWSKITPTSPLREIEAQRKRALDLRDQIPKRRATRDAAAAQVVELERADRQRMADALAAGKDAKPNVEQIERGRADAGGAGRAFEALALAIESAEQGLHDSVLKHR